MPPTSIGSHWIPGEPIVGYVDARLRHEARMPIAGSRAGTWRIARADNIGGFTTFLDDDLKVPSFPGRDELIRLSIRLLDTLAFSSHNDFATLDQMQFDCHLLTSQPKTTGAIVRGGESVDLVKLAILDVALYRLFTARS